MTPISRLSHAAGRLAAAALAALLIAPVPAAHAQDAYSPGQVVDFLVNSADLGKARGICIGTPEECAPPEPEGLDMLVTFELDSADLTPEARQSLTVFAEALQDERLEIASFVVEGHTDARGSAAYNTDLSEARAAAVTEFLAGLGVAEDRLTAIGLGMTSPRTDDPLDPENRRVELRLDLQ